MKVEYKGYLIEDAHTPGCRHCFLISQGGQFISGVHEQTTVKRAKKTVDRLINGTCEFAFAIKRTAEQFRQEVHPERIIHERAGWFYVTTQANLLEAMTEKEFVSVVKSCETVKTASEIEKGFEDLQSIIETAHETQTKVFKRVRQMMAILKLNMDILKIVEKRHKSCELA